MSDFTTKNAETTEPYFSYLAKTQAQFLEGLRETSVFAPELPAFSPTFQAPSAQKLPTAREVTEAGFDFTERLVAQQKSFVERYFDVTESKVASVEAEAEETPVEANVAAVQAAAVQADAVQPDAVDANSVEGEVKADEAEAVIVDAN